MPFITEEIWQNLPHEGESITIAAWPVVDESLSDKERASEYRRFADEVGVLFQIVDDILDVTGSEEDLGKPRGSDEKHGKLTYVSLYSLKRARALAAE